MCTHWCCHVRQVPNAFFFTGLISACTQQGVLKGFDQTTNVVLDKCHERVYHGYHEPAEDVPLGLYIIRGDNLFACTHTFSSTSLPFFFAFFKTSFGVFFSAMIGKLNEELDKQTDISTVCAPPLHPVRF